MSSDAMGGGGADGRGAVRLEERLARRFAAELAQAESDYAHVTWRPRRVAARRRSLAAIPVLAAAVVALVVIAQPPFRGPATPQPRIVFGADAFPIEFDGEKVLTPAEALRAPGSILVAGTIRADSAACSIDVDPKNWRMPVGADTVPSGPIDRCESPALVLYGSASEARLAPSHPDLPDQQEVILRVHASSPNASACPEGACYPTLVVESVVARIEPPAEVGGFRVLTTISEVRAASGDFAIGGVASLWAMGCPSTGTPQPQPDTDMLPFCSGTRIGDITVVPRVRLPVGPAVVVRAHIHDPLAQSCKPENVPACEAMIVADGMLWPPSIATKPPTAPAAEIVFDTDGVPTSVDGERVYRPAEASAALDAHPTILLAGVQAPPFVPSCWAPGQPSPGNAADRALVGSFCASLPELVLGGTAVSIGDLGPTLPTSHLVVVRVHENDPLAEQCVQAEACRKTLVAESLIWDSGRVWVEMAGDGLPARIGGLPVTRSMCPSGDCLIGGVLERDGAGWKVSRVAFTASNVAGIAATADVTPAPATPAEWASLEGKRVVVATTVLTSTPWTYEAGLVWTESGGLR